MNNEAVILSFLTRQKAQTAKRIIPTKDGEAYYEGRTLTSDGETLINYQTAIAKHIDDKIYLNTKHYGTTTTTIQKKIKQLANEKGLRIIECKGFIEK